MEGVGAQVRRKLLSELILETWKEDLEFEMGATSHRTAVTIVVYRLGGLDGDSGFPL
jgi:hypothetical protein